MKQVTFAYSFQGASHIRKEESCENRERKFPCQDRSFAGDFAASEIAEKKEVALFVKDKSIPSSAVLLPVTLNPHKAAFSLVCVSDGHGGAPYFRSQKGAEFAIQTVIELLSESIDKIGLALEKKDFNRLNSNLSTSFVRRWIQKIIVDVAGTDRSIFEKELNELRQLDEKAWKVYRAELEDAYTLATKYVNSYQNPANKEENNDVLSNFSKLDIKSIYGCTIVAYFRIKETPLWYAFKVGDSDIFMSFDDEYFKPIADDPQCYDNVTTSLCNDNVVKDFCFPETKYLERVPKTVFCSSDGVANSFTGEDFLKKFYMRLQFSCDEDGQEKTRSEMKETLPLLGEKGSGDDISLAGIITYDDSVVRKEQRREAVCKKAKECYESGNYAAIELLFKPYLDRNESHFKLLMACYDCKEAEKFKDVGMTSDFLTQWNKAYSSMTSVANDYAQKDYLQKVEKYLEGLRTIMIHSIEQDVRTRYREITYNSIEELFRPFIGTEPNLYSFYKAVYEYNWLHQCFVRGVFITFYEMFNKIEEDLACLARVDHFNFVEGGNNILRKMLSNLHVLKSQYWSL